MLNDIIVKTGSYNSLEFYQCSKLLRIQTVASVFLKLAGGIIRPEMFTYAMRHNKPHGAFFHKATLFCTGAQWRPV